MKKIYEKPNVTIQYLSKEIVTQSSAVGDTVDVPFADLLNKRP